jgi:glycosyltransferase involved in cell wall biosynthesis
MTHIKYKSIDLRLWSPSLNIPSEHKLPHSQSIRILHSAYLSKSGRDWQGRNIKGSPFVLAAIERLKNEGHPVEYFFIHDKPSNQMRFYQSQADIVVEQLIYGWWGSTFVETSALGKPVVCYLRPAWKDFFLKTFPEYSNLPVVEADTQSIYEALKKLVTDADYRRQKGEESRRFAEAHFDPEKNAEKLIKLLEAL